MNDPFGIYRAAKRRLPLMMFDFIDGGTGFERAQTSIRNAFDAIELQSRVLRNVENISAETTFLGKTYALPFGIAPMGMCNLIHTKADLALSALARTQNIPHCVSTAASTTLEETFQDAGGNAWFQLYAGSDENLTFEMIDRATAAGYQNLVFTVDTPRHSRRTRDLENGFSVPLKIGPKQFFDFASHPAWSFSMIAQFLKSNPPRPMNYHASKITNGFERGDSRGAADFDFLGKIRDHWKGHLIVKGVTSADDAARIKRAGCDAVYVSNHGGRQLDSGTPAISNLPNIRQAVGEDYPLIFDSGIRSGDDIVRALAMGADFVMIGRPMLYALGGGGPDKLDLFTDRLIADLLSVMAQIGATGITDIDASVLANR